MGAPGFPEKIAAVDQDGLAIDGDDLSIDGAEERFGIDATHDEDGLAGVNRRGELDEGSSPRPHHWVGDVSGMPFWIRFEPGEGKTREAAAPRFVQETLPW